MVVRGAWGTCQKNLAIANWWGEIVLCVAAVAVLMGCSGRTSTYPVTGTAKLANGKPLAGARILFQPMGESSQPAKATIGDDGAFELGTFNKGDGAVPGEHRVAIYPLVPADASNDRAAIARYRSIIDSRFQNIQTTPLEYTVKADGTSNHFDIVIKSTEGAKTTD
jgi:hypothetical protein